MTDLRTSLHRLADSTDPLPVDDDLWRRGQAARHRGQALVVAAVLAIIASVTWSAVLLGTDDREARTASTDVVPGGAIPSRIDDVPADLPLTMDLAVGRASAAFVSSTGEPVVITATDGVPHKLALAAFGPDQAAFALSPDGRTLAFQQLSDEGTRVTLLDLESGRTKPLLVHAGDRLEIDAISWSPDSSWVAWAATQMGQVPAAVGQIRTTGRESRRLLPASSMSSVAIADDGDVVLGRVSGALVSWPWGGDPEPLPSGADLAAGAFSPDNTRVAVASGPGTASWTVDTSNGQVRSHPFPEGTIGDSVVRPLGWLDERLQLLLVQPVDGSDAELVVTTPEVGATSTWRGSVGSVGTTGIANSLSLAVDLVPDLDGTSSQRLTHDFGDPLPDQRRDISWLIGLGVAAATAVLMALRWLLRRLLR